VSAAEVAGPIKVEPPESSARPPTFLRRLLQRPLAIACLAYLAIVVIVAIVAPFVFPDVATEYAGDLTSVLEGPSRDHWLGTDASGRDVLQRILVGTRPTMLGVAYAIIVAFLIGVPLGLAAGYFGGKTDRALGWVSDLGFAIPGIAIVLVVLSVFPQSMLAGMIAVGVLASPHIIRIVRSATLPVREEQYIAAAQVSGLSRRHIVGRHVLTRIVGAVIVLGSLFAAGALLAQTGLAYLGLIVPLPEPSWGGMVGEGIQNIVNQPWLIWPPGVVMVLTIVAFGLLGDAVRDTSAESWAAAPVQRSTKRRLSSVPSGSDPAPLPASDALLSVEGLSLAFPSPAGPVSVIHDVSFQLNSGETVGIVGESGCGKTVTAMALLGMVPGHGEIVGGRILFDGRDITALTGEQLRRVRGREIGLISQEPMVSLNPAYRVGWQLALSIRTHHGVSHRVANERAVELLRSVHLPEPELVARRYPHELSGGMAQRVAIARALSGEPKLLIADEPTTALDVTVQAEILELLRELQQERGMAVLLVTHDWGVVADLCERAIVMYAGQVVEQATVASLFGQPLHPYTEALLGSNPHSAPDDSRLPTIPGSVPRPGRWPEGCHFHPRCKHATPECSVAAIELQRPLADSETRCIHYDRLMVTK
jgi:peptide/nickel transport system permease protein